MIVTPLVGAGESQALASRRHGGFQFPIFPQAVGERFLPEFSRADCRLPWLAGKDSSDTRFDRRARIQNRNPKQFGFHPLVRTIVRSLAGAGRISTARCSGASKRATRSASSIGVPSGL